MADGNPPRPPRDIRRRRRGAGVRSFVAVALAAGVLAAANALSAKGLYAHWTVRPDTALSDRTRRILADTEGALELRAVFERSHPFRTPARRLLAEFAEAARTLPGLRLSVREVDMNHEPAEASALLRRFPSAANSIVVSFGGRDRVLDEYELSAPAAAGADAGDAAEAAGARFDGERAVSAAILRLVHPVRQKVCFTSGHGEFDPESTHPVGGASSLAHALSVAGYETRRLSESEREVPADCGVLVVAGPRTMFSAQEVESLSSWLSRGGRALVLVDDPHAAGLAPLLRAWDVELADPPAGARGARVSTLEYGAHDAARDMANVLTVFSAPCEVRPVNDGPAENRADKPRAEALAFVGASDARRSVAVASEQLPAGAGAPRGGTRLVVFGDSEFVSNGMLDGGREGNAMLFCAAANWLAGVPRPHMPAPASAGLDAGVAPDDGWIRLVLLLALAVPGAILLFGLLVWSPVSNQL